MSIADVYMGGLGPLQGALQDKLKYKMEQDRIRRERVQQLFAGMGKAAEVYQQHQVETEDKADADAFSQALVADKPTAYMDYMKQNPAKTDAVAKQRMERVQGILTAHRQAQEYDFKKKQEVWAGETHQQEKDLFPYKLQESKSQAEESAINRDLAKQKSEEFKSTGALRRKKLESNVEEDSLSVESARSKGALISRQVELGRKEDLSDTYAAAILNDPENNYLHDPSIAGKDLSVDAYDEALANNKIKSDVGPIWEEAKNKVRQQLIERDKLRMEEMKNKDAITNKRAEKYISAGMDKWHQRGSSVAADVYKQSLPNLAGATDIGSVQSTHLQARSALEKAITNDPSLEDGTDLGMYRGRARTEALEQGNKELDRLFYPHIMDASREKSPDQNMMVISNFLEKQYKEGFIDKNGIRRVNPMNDFNQMMDPQKQAAYERAFQETYAGQIGKLDASRGGTQDGGDPIIQSGNQSGGHFNDSSNDLKKASDVLDKLSQKYGTQEAGKDPAVR